MFSKIKSIPYHDINGLLESIQPLEEVTIETSVGPLIPIYFVEDHGRKKLSPVKFNSDGKIKSINLQKATVVKTSVGDISTELITFYPSGSIRRIFPLNGKLSGYWSENDEYKLSPTIEIPTSLGVISAKPIYIHFYETGELKSITFWPKERIFLSTHIGEIDVKTGISFYKSGKIRSIEPANPVSINTPIGRIKAFDPDPIGVNGESNSLSFYEDGNIEKISTISSSIIAETDSETLILNPQEVPSHCNDEEFMIQPLKIEFGPLEYKFKYNFKVIATTPRNANYKISRFKSTKKIFCATSATC